MTETLTSNTLAGTQWVLAALGGQKPIAGAQVTLNFGGDGRAAGTDGCNRFSGAYHVEGASLAFGPMAGTLMACPPEVMTQSRAFVQALSSTRAFARPEDTLSLSDAAGAVLATFTALRTELAGTQWVVTGYNNGRQAVVSLLQDTEITVEFGREGRVAGSAGCNHYRGSFTQGEGTIAFSPLASTRKLCPAPEGVMAQETQFLQALASAATWHMDGDRLMLRTKDNALAVSLRRAS
jgi:heat shock protein HslJ